MADSAAHLRDCAFPSVPVRQWVFTLPKRLRFLLAWRPKFISLLLRLFLRALFAWQRRCARKQGISAPLRGAVSFVQRYGASLNLDFHVHAMLPDGVFSEEDDGQVRFHPLLPPKYSHLEKLIRKLVPPLVRKLGDEELPEQAQWLQALCQILSISVAPRSAMDVPLSFHLQADGQHALMPLMLWPHEGRIDGPTSMPFQLEIASMGIFGRGQTDMTRRTSQDYRLQAITQPAPPPRRARETDH